MNKKTLRSDISCNGAGLPGFIRICEHFKRTSGRHLGIADGREFELIFINALFSAGKCLAENPEY
jgi:hypothetical protein